MDLFSWQCCTLLKYICLERMVKVICMYASIFLFDSFNVRSFHSKLCFICWKSNTRNILWHSLSYIYVTFEQLSMRTFGASLKNAFCVISNCTKHTFLTFHWLPFFRFTPYTLFDLMLNCQCMTEVLEHVSNK